jgi:flagellar biogenesis protein FliO
VPWLARPEAKLLLGSLVLVVLLWAAARLVKRLPIGRLLPGVQGPIRVVARTHLGAKESLCLIDVGGAAILLAVTAQSIQAVHVWPHGVGTAAPPREGAGVTAARSPAEAPVLPGQLRNLQTWLRGTRA